MYDIQKRILYAVNSVECSESDNVITFSRTKLFCFKAFLLKHNVIFKRGQRLCIYEKHYKEIMRKVSRHYEKPVLESRLVSSSEVHLSLFLENVKGYLDYLIKTHDIHDSYVLLKCSRIRNAKLLNRLNSKELLKYENGNAYINVFLLEKLYRKYRGDENFKRYFRL